LAYDTTNFYTYIASTNQRNRLAQPASPGNSNLVIGKWGTGAAANQSLFI